MWSGRSTISVPITIVYGLNLGFLMAAAGGSSAPRRLPRVSLIICGRLKSCCITRYPSLFGAPKTVAWLTTIPCGATWNSYLVPVPKLSFALCEKRFGWKTKPLFVFGGGGGILIVY